VSCFGAPRTCRQPRGSRSPTPTTVARRIGRRSAIVASAVLAIVVAAAALWAPRFAAVSSGRTGPPVIVLIDSPHPERVYDPETRRTGGTNADDLTDLLRDMPIVLIKENTSATWHRENQVLQEDPTLVVAHRAAFYDTTLFDPAKYGDVGHTRTVCRACGRQVRSVHRLHRRGKSTDSLRRVLPWVVE
jgi:hypothetical protein